MDLTLAICVYNAERYIEDTLSDVVAQSAKGFNLLIIDDCSSDKTVELIEKFKINSGFEVSLICLDKNKGIANARNLALNTATTHYLLFIDADDRIDPHIVEKLYNQALKDRNIMAVTCWSRYMNANGKVTGGGTYLGVRSFEEFNEKASKGKLFFMPIHTLFDRVCAIEAGGFITEGFPEGKPRYQDYCEELDLWTRMSDQYVNGRYFFTIPETLYYYRKSNGLSSNHFNMIIKMKYTKVNVRLRRAGKKDITFNEFYSSLSPKEINAIKREGFAADALRNGVLLLKGRNPIKGAWLIMRSIAAKPSYFFDKLKHNL